MPLYFQQSSNIICLDNFGGGSLTACIFQIIKKFQTEGSSFALLIMTKCNKDCLCLHVSEHIPFNKFVRAPVNRENFFNCSCYRKRRGKVSSMSSFNSWLIIVSLLYNVLLYRSSARSTYPPSGEFLHQVNLFYRYLKITDCASFAVFPEGKRT